MNWDQIEDHWEEYKDLAREKWTRLGSTTIEQINGSRERLIDAVQRSYDISRDQARREVGYWAASAPLERAARAQSRMAVAQRGTGFRERGTAVAGAAQRSRQSMAMTGRMIRDHPAASLLLAFGLGMLITGLLRRS